jgi:hypothetical protein
MSTGYQALIDPLLSICQYLLIAKWTYMCHCRVMCILVVGTNKFAQCIMACDCTPWGVYRFDKFDPLTSLVATK